MHARRANTPAGELARLQADADIERDAAIAEARTTAKRVAAVQAAAAARWRLSWSACARRAKHAGWRSWPGAGRCGHRARRGHRRGADHRRARRGCAGSSGSHAGGRVGARARGGEARRLAELARLQHDADIERDAAIAEARTTAERIAAGQAKAAATLAVESERVRAEGEARRLAELARLQADADIERDAAIAEARTTAERDARRAGRRVDARAFGAEGVFAADLARVRAEVEEKLSAQVGAAETRLAVAEHARRDAEAAAAAALHAEVARVRGEAEARLQAELERIRKAADAAKIAELSEAKYATEQIRESAAREARAIAEQAGRRTLEEELLRVRVQADTFLETEVARVRAEGQERQAAELQELRDQMAEIREDAARTAAEQSGDYYKIWQTRPELVEPEPPVEPVATEPDDAEPAGTGKYLRVVKWALPTAACLLLLFNNGIVIDTFASFGNPLPKKKAIPIHAVEPVDPPVAEKTTGGLKVESTPVGAELLVDGRRYGKTPITITDLKPGVRTMVLRTSGLRDTASSSRGQTTLASK